MWGRRQSAAAPAAKANEAKTEHGPRALRAPDDLLRRADWDRLGDQQRATLANGLPTFPAPVADAMASEPAAEAIQDWTAALVAGAFQAEPAQIIGGWLADASDAHLYVGGGTGVGRGSMVAALARQALAGRPGAPDYCYIPQPDALNQAYLLALPTGTGEAFAAAIDKTLRAITGGWPGDDDDGAQSDKPAPPLPTLVAEAFAPLERSAPEDARPYLQRLRAAFDALAVAGAPLPCAYEAMPTWLARPQASLPDPAGQKSAPVITGTLIRDRLDDLLMRANGGVLILPATDVLITDGAWPSLAAALGSRGLSIKGSWPPLPLSTRVALIGDGGAYNALANAPGEFGRLFRYEAWCNDAADWNPQAEAIYAAFAAGVARRYALPAFDPSGVARLTEEGARRAGGLNRARLSTDLLMLHDLAREAGRAAYARGSATTGGDDVEAALARRRILQGVNARRVREAILTGQEITPTAGAAIGQVNGLGIYEFHPPEGNFAVPTRISATVSAGRDERLLDIEHEAEQADADHVRGEMTVEGYLAYRYGQGQPITLVARIRFEQEHGTTGGDSASGAILFSLLSALADLPIRFSYAVTGAVGQYGEIQPIGGVNTKIEGFWELCRQRRAQGEHVEGGYGVIIPAVNARDLMLRAEVADSIAREGWFHVWPVTTVDEAMTLLTGVPAPQLNARVQQRLQRFHAIGGRPGNGR